MSESILVEVLVKEMCGGCLFEKDNGGCIHAYIDPARQLVRAEEGICRDSAMPSEDGKFPEPGTRVKLPKGWQTISSADLAKMEPLKNGH